MRGTAAERPAAARAHRAAARHRATRYGSGCRSNGCWCSPPTPGGCRSEAVGHEPSRRRPDPARRRRVGTGWPSAASTGCCCCWCPASSSWSLLFVYPFLYGLQLSFQPKERGRPVRELRRVLHRPVPASTPSGSRCGSRCPAALFNVLASIPIAYQMRGRFRGKRTLTTLLVVPITLGTVLTARRPDRVPRPAGLVQPDPAAVRAPTSRSGWCTTTGACCSR